MNKMSTKIKWVVGLLIFRIIGSVIFSLATIGNMGRLLHVEFDSLAGYFVFAFLYEQLPTIATVLLIFYHHKQPKSENTGFTLMQKWTFVLVWVQQAYSLLSFALLGIFGQIVWSWLGGCAWLALITFLLYSAWNNPVEVEKLPAVYTDGGHAHARSHNAYGNALPCAGITLYTADIVYQNGVFKKIFCYEF